MDIKDKLNLQSLSALLKHLDEFSEGEQSKEHVLLQNSYSHPDNSGGSVQNAAQQWYWQLITQLSLEEAPQQLQALLNQFRERFVNTSQSNLSAQDSDVPLLLNLCVELNRLNAAALDQVLLRNLSADALEQTDCSDDEQVTSICFRLLKQFSATGAALQQSSQLGELKLAQAQAFMCTEIGLSSLLHSAPPQSSLKKNIEEYFQKRNQLLKQPVTTQSLCDSFKLLCEVEQIKHAHMAIEPLTLPEVEQVSARINYLLEENKKSFEEFKTNPFHSEASLDDRLQILAEQMKTVRTFYIHKSKLLDFIGQVREETLEAVDWAGVVAEVPAAHGTATELLRLGEELLALRRSSLARIKSALTVSPTFVEELKENTEALTNTLMYQRRPPIQLIQLLETLNELKIPGLPDLLLMFESDPISPCKFTDSLSPINYSTPLSPLTESDDEVELLIPPSIPSSIPSSVPSSIPHSLAPSTPPTALPPSKLIALLPTQALEEVTKTLSGEDGELATLKQLLEEELKQRPPAAESAELKLLKQKELLWQNLMVSSEKLLSELKQQKHSLQATEDVKQCLARLGRPRSPEPERPTPDSFLNHLLRNPTMLQRHFEQFHEDLEVKEKQVEALHKELEQKSKQLSKILLENQKLQAQQGGRRPGRGFRPPAVEDETAVQLESHHRVVRGLKDVVMDALTHADRLKQQFSEEDLHAVYERLQSILKEFQAITIDDHITQQLEQLKRDGDQAEAKEADIALSLNLFSEKLRSIYEDLRSSNQAVPKYLMSAEQLISEIQALQASASGGLSETIKEHFYGIVNKISQYESDLKILGVSRGWEPIVSETPLAQYVKSDYSLLSKLPESPALLKEVIKQLYIDIRDSDRKVMYCKEIMQQQANQLKEADKLNRILFTKLMGVKEQHTLLAYIQEAEPRKEVGASLKAMLQFLSTEGLRADFFEDSPALPTPEQTTPLTEILYQRLQEKDAKIAQLTRDYEALLVSKPAAQETDPSEQRGSSTDHSPQRSEPLVGMLYHQLYSQDKLLAEEKHQKKQMFLTIQALESSVATLQSNKGTVSASEAPERLPQKRLLKTRPSSGHPIIQRFQAQQERFKAIRDAFRLQAACVSDQLSIQSSSIEESRVPSEKVVAEDSRQRNCVLLALLSYKKLFQTRNAAFRYWKQLTLYILNNEPPAESPSIFDTSEFERLAADLIAQHFSTLPQNNPLLALFDTLGSAEPLNYLKTFKLLEEFIQYKYYADFKALKAKKTLVSVPQAFREFVLGKYKSEEILKNALAGLQLLLKQNHPYAKIHADLLQLSPATSVPLAFAVFVIKLSMKFNELTDKFEALRSYKTKADRQLNTFDIAGNGGQALLADTLHLVYSVFKGDRHGGTFVVEKLCPDSLPPKAYLAFVISDKLQHKGKKPLDIVLLAKKSQGSVLTIQEFTTVCQHELGVWISREFVESVFAKPELKQTELCSWLNLSNYAKAVLDLGLNVTKCKLLDTFADCYKWQVVQDGARVLAQLADTGITRFDAASFSQFLEEHLQVKVSESIAAQAFKGGTLGAGEAMQVALESGLGGLGLRSFLVQGLFVDSQPSKRKKR